jgi:hypothetical protein
LLPLLRGQIAFGNDKRGLNDHPMSRKLLLFFILILAFSQPLHSTILYVDANVQGGNQDGTSWADAMPGLAEAISLAAYGDTLWVAQGVYLPTMGTNRNFSFILKNGVRLFGGFNGTEAAFGERDCIERRHRCARRQHR